MLMTNMPFMATNQTGTNRVITLTNLMQRATNAPKAGTNIPPATGTNATASTNIPLLIKPVPSTNKP
jgi:hypothetical protein